MTKYYNQMDANRMRFPVGTGVVVHHSSDTDVGTPIYMLRGFTGSVTKYVGERDGVASIALTGYPSPIEEADHVAIRHWVTSIDTMGHVDISLMAWSMDRFLRVLHLSPEQQRELDEFTKAING